MTTEGENQEVDFEEYVDLEVEVDLVDQVVGDGVHPLQDMIYPLEKQLLPLSLGHETLPAEEKLLPPGDRLLACGDLLPSPVNLLPPPDSRLLPLGERLLSCGGRLPTLWDELFPRADQLLTHGDQPLPHGNLFPSPGKLCSPSGDLLASPEDLLLPPQDLLPPAGDLFPPPREDSSANTVESNSMATGTKQKSIRKLTNLEKRRLQVYKPRNKKGTGELEIVPLKRVENYAMQTYREGTAVLDEEKATAENVCSKEDDLIKFNDDIPEQEAKLENSEDTYLVASWDENDESRGIEANCVTYYEVKVGRTIDEKDIEVKRLDAMRYLLNIRKREGQTSKLKFLGTF